MKKICFVTAARSEYGLLKWIMKAVEECPKFLLQLVVTGGHLLVEQGYTVNQIIEDGFKINEIVDVKIDTSSKKNIAQAMGDISEKISDTFEKLMPDLLVVLGDRYELLPVCSTALIMNIPIAHISGGDVTEGAIDDKIRNAITMMATYHFPGTRESASNIERMTGSGENIWVVGEPGLDGFKHIDAMGRDELANMLKLDSQKKWVLLTYHPETKESLEFNLETAKNITRALMGMGENYQTVITYANADFGGDNINEYYKLVAQENSKSFVQIPSLGQLKYLSFMKQAEFVIGNSSSGIVETPYLKVSTINIGNRQKGRHICSNIIECGNSYEEISEAIKKVSMGLKLEDDGTYWGNGNTAETIINILSDL